MLLRLLALANVTAACLAGTAIAAEPLAISQPRDEIGDLFFYAGYGEVAWNWRDGDREGSSVIDDTGVEAVRPPGLIPDPYFDIAAYSQEGTLTVVRDGESVTIARDRPRVSDERFVAYPPALAWVERGRRLYASVANARSADYIEDVGPLGRPRLLARGGIRSVALAQGRRSAIVWQDGRNRIRARIRTRRRGFARPLTVASPSGLVDDLRVTWIGRIRSTAVLWSTPSGVRVALKHVGDPHFGRVVRLSTKPASGLVTSFREKQAWGEPGGIHFAFLCGDRIRERIIPVAGTPHLDGFTDTPQVVYTLDGSVYFDGERLGPGHDARILSHDVVWIDGNRVLKAQPETPQGPLGEFAPDGCEE